MILLQTSGDAGFIDKLIHLDQQIFLVLNGEWRTGFLDAYLPYVREAIIWTPLYLFLFALVWMNFGLRGLLWIVFALLTAALTDIVSSGLLKQNIMRLRPCRDPQFSQHVYMIVKYCPQSSSFTSSHAANHFGAAMFSYITLRHTVSKWMWLLFVWAGLICYAQVYVGVHYPLDLLAGALVGSIIGWFSAGFFNRRIGLRTFGQLSTES